MAADLAIASALTGVLGAMRWAVSGCIRHALGVLLHDAGSISPRDSERLYESTCPGVSVHASAITGKAHHMASLSSMASE